MKLNRHWYLCDLIVVWRIAHCHIVLITITRKYFSTKMFHSNWHYQGTFQQYHSDNKILRWCICLHRRSIIFLQAFATDSLDSCCCARIWSYKSPDQKSVVTRWDQCWKIRPYKPQLDQEMCSHVRYCQERWKQTMWVRIFADKHTILTLIRGVNSGALLWRILWHNAGWWSMQNCDNRERGVHWWVMIIWHRWICFDHIHYNNRFVFQEWVTMFFLFFEGKCQPTDVTRFIIFWSNKLSSDGVILNISWLSSERMTLCDWQADSVTFISWNIFVSFHDNHIWREQGGAGSYAVELGIILRMFHQIFSFCSNFIHSSLSCFMLAAADFKSFYCGIMYAQK